jgi:hypothetical protein
MDEPAIIDNNSIVSNTNISYFNPLPSLMLRSAWDLNVPSQPKRSKALLLTPQKNRIFFKTEGLFTF